MGSLIRAMFALLIGLVAAVAVAGSAAADPDEAHAQAAKDGPLWERAKYTHFSAMRCSSGAALIDQLTINRNEASETSGHASYTDATRDKGYETGAGGWSLTGDELKVSGDGFRLEGRWVGPFLTAVITWTDGSSPVRCRFQVPALRQFTEYQ